MKRLITLISVVCLIFASGALADDVCYKCDKCDTGYIPLPGSTTTAGPQGTSTTVDDMVYPFDYDGRLQFDINQFGSYGYCQATDYNYWDGAEGAFVVRNERRDCKLIFDVCKCSQAHQITTGKTIGIQMEILTKGVYWAEDLDEIEFDIQDVYTDFCKKNPDGTPAVKNMATRDFYYDANNQLIVNDVGTENPNLNAQTADIQTRFRSFGGIVYYRNISGTVPSVVGHPLTTPSKSELIADNKVKVLQSTMQDDYMFTRQDTLAYDYCNMWINIPAMRVNPGEVTEGAEVKVAIRLLFNRTNDGICPSALDLCECTRTVGIIGCAEAVNADKGCMFFPYVLQGDVGTWGTGIVVSARGEMPEAPECKLTLTDADGNSNSYTNTDVKTIWAFMMNSVLDEFGSEFTAGAATLKVETNYRVDGYEFLTDGNFGAGTLPRGCSSCCPDTK